jgi:hypothetical protein
VLDLCGKFAVNEQDRLVLEQYRPYITMMNVRANASLLFKRSVTARQWTRSRKGLAAIKGLLRPLRPGRRVPALQRGEGPKKFAREIRRKLPVDPVQKLQVAARTAP